MKTKNDKIEELLKKYRNWVELSFGADMATDTKPFDYFTEEQTIQRFQSLFEIDKKKLKLVIKKIDFNKNKDIVTGARKVWFSLSGLNKIVEAIIKGDINGKNNM